MAKKRTTDQLLAALAVGEPRAVKELEAIAAAYEGRRLQELAIRSQRHSAARPAVARVAIPQLTQWIGWRDLDPELVELCGKDVALLWALCSQDEAVRAEADAVVMRGADVAKARRFLALLHTEPFAHQRGSASGSSRCSRSTARRSRPRTTT